MPSAVLEIVTVPCLEDNYAFVIGNLESKEAAVVDVPEAGPIKAALKAKGWTLTTVLLTHHHWDHVDGLADLPNLESLVVVGAQADAHRLPDLTFALGNDQSISILGHSVQTFDVSGHTVGHIAFYIPAADAIFTGDSLMAMGCGRLFEGTPAQMWDSLQKISALPGETLVHSGHEYTATNVQFALTLGEDNPDLAKRAAAVTAARAKGTPTVPSTLAEEMATNPFLRADSPPLQSALGMDGADALAVFTEIRTRRNNF